MQKMEIHVSKVEARLRNWGAKIDELVARAELPGATISTDHRERMKELRAKHEAAGSKLKELRAAGRHGWESLKTGVESACIEIEVAFRKLTAT